MIGLYITSALTLLAGTISSYLYSKQKHTLRLIFKSLASLLFCATGLLAILLSRTFSVYSLGVMAALILGLVGDIFLCLDSLLPEEKSKMLMNGIGLLAFLAGHVFFIIIFMQKAPFKLQTLPIILIIPLLFLFAHKLRLINSPKSVVIPCLVYGMFLGLTVTSTVSLYLTERSLAHLIALFAALLFTISDSTLVIRFFSVSNERKNYILMYVVLFSYYMAQSLFAITIILN
ncbi:MAG: lysoplasmalogenase [Christensenellaceae bacterium]|jgi:uncharacterized membrane protein YhhN|nr:lysoplasmalogenase [Christensenellaceae bacterium]